MPDQRPARLPPPSTPPRPVRVGVAVAVVLAALGTTVLLHLRYPSLLGAIPSTDMRDGHVDFDTFWHSAVALTQGLDIYDTPAKLHNLNPPLLSVLLTPFAALDSLTAYRLFAGITLVLVLGALLAVARELRLPAGVTVVALLAALASSSLHGTLVLGQIYPLLLVALVAGWLAERRGRPVAAAVLYGVAVALKPSLAPLLLLPAVQRRWVPLRAGLLSAAVASVVGVLVAGPTSGFEWLRIALTEVIPVTVDNASLPGLTIRFGLTRAPGLVLGLVVLIGTLAWCARRRERIDPAGTAPWAVLAASLLLAPIAWHNYLMLLFPGVLVLCALHRRALAAALLAVAVVPVSWDLLWPPDGVGQAIARSLYCGILLAYWVALLSSAARPPVDDPLRDGAVGAPTQLEVSPTRASSAD